VIAFRKNLIETESESSDKETMKRRSPLFLLLALVVPFREATAVAPSVSFDGQSVNLSAENGSFGQILDMFKQQTGLEYDIPLDFRSQRLPLVDIHGLSMRTALLKIFEGCNYDYILMAEPANPEKISKVLVTGRSTKISSGAVAVAGTALPRRVARHIVEDPFGGGGEEGVDDANINEGEAGNQPAMENPAAPGVAPVQPGVQPQPGALLPGQVNPGQPVPSQPYPPGMMPQQQPGQPLIQPQVLQPVPGNNNNPNDRRSPF
jgi:hypothetical protein